MAATGGVATIILIASVLIPVAKFIVLAGLAVGVWYGPRATGGRRQVLYEIVEYIGRWSMIDVFVVAILSSLVQLQTIASITPGRASLFFALSVIFTMLSAQSFDSRLIWDTRSGRNGRGTAQAHSSSQEDTRTWQLTTAPHPEAPVKSARRGLMERISIIWIVPLAALLVVLFIAWQSYTDRGPLVEISFENAAGVKEGSTELRYRDVAIGLVEEVGFTEGLGRVLVSVRVDKDVAPFIDKDARFWVVRPQVTTQGVTGLNTVLSGVYIEGLWDDQPGGYAGRFEGLPDAPLEREGKDGLRLTLRASGKASLFENTPILYRGVTVGRVGKPSISEDGSTAQAEAMIFEPHDRLVSSATRFLGHVGLFLLAGAQRRCARFQLRGLSRRGRRDVRDHGVGRESCRSRDHSSPSIPRNRPRRTSLFAADEGEALSLSVVFSENIGGLTADAPVEMNGLKIGEVTSLNGMIDEEEFGDNRVRLVRLAVDQGRPAGPWR